MVSFRALWEGLAQAPPGPLAKGGGILGMAVGTATATTARVRLAPERPLERVRDVVAAGRAA